MDQWQVQLVDGRVITVSGVELARMIRERRVFPNTKVCLPGHPWVELQATQQFASVFQNSFAQNSAPPAVMDKRTMIITLWVIGGAIALIFGVATYSEWEKNAAIEIQQANQREEAAAKKAEVEAKEKAFREMPGDQKITMAKSLQAKGDSDALKEAERYLGGVQVSDPKYSEAQSELKKLKAEALRKINEEERIRTAEAAKNRQEEQKRKLAQVPEMRKQLEGSFRDCVAGANTHLNFIGSRITKVKGGYAIWATHEFFTRYSFSAGNDADIVQAWINRNRQDLKDCNIVRVGLMGTGPFSSYTYFDLN